MALFVTNLDITAVNILLPLLTRVFGASSNEVSRVVLLYVLASTRRPS